MKHWRLKCSCALVMATSAGSAAAHDDQVVEYRFTKQTHRSNFEAEPPPRRTRDLPRERPVDPPSVFAYGLYGMVSGAALGLSAGYLAGRDSQEPRRALTLGAAIGLASGAGLGVAAGMWDLSSESPGRFGYYAARDTFYGTLFGALVGSATGGILALDSGEGKEVLTGLSIGSLAGGGLGLVIGIVDASTRSHVTRRERASRLHLDLAVLNEPGKAPLYTPTLSGAF